MGYRELQQNLIIIKDNKMIIIFELLFLLFFMQSNGSTVKWKFK